MTKLVADIQNSKVDTKAICTKLDANKKELLDAFYKDLEIEDPVRHFF